MVFLLSSLFGSNPPPPQLSHHIAFLASLLVFLLFSVAGTAYPKQADEREGMEPNKATAEERRLFQEGTRSHLWASRLIVSVYVKLFS
jgi:hypothetical protein